MGKDILPPRQIHPTDVSADQLTQTEQINTSEELLGKLYDRTVEWLVENDGEVIQEFGPQEIKDWETITDFHKGSHSLSLNLLKACVVEDSRKVFLLTLGRGWRSQYSYGDSLRFQFGFFPTTFEQAQTTEESGLRGIKWILNHQGISGPVGSGEISAIPGNSKIIVDCWANDSLFGGKGIDNWPSEKILTTQGLEESLNVIKETVKRAFSKDLT